MDSFPRIDKMYGYVSEDRKSLKINIDKLPRTGKTKFTIPTSGWSFLFHNITWKLSKSSTRPEIVDVFPLTSKI